MKNLKTLNYNEIPVFFQSDDAYLNATQIAKAFNKQPADYLKQKRTVEYIEGVKRNRLLQEIQLVTVNTGSPENGGGTYIHPKLAIDFARWLNVDFAVWCDIQIEEILKGNVKPIVTAMTPKDAIPFAEGYLAFAQLLQVPVHLAQIECVKMTYRETQVDFSPMLKLAPAQDNIQEDSIMLEPTELGRKLGYTAVEMNQVLERLGLQSRPDGKTWVVSDKGESISFHHSWTKYGKSGYNYKWNVSEIEKLLPKSL
jgi:hypothetical protein